MKEHTFYEIKCDFFDSYYFICKDSKKIEELKEKLKNLVGNFEITCHYIPTIETKEDLESLINFIKKDQENPFRHFGKFPGMYGY